MGLGLLRPPGEGLLRTQVPHWPPLAPSSSSQSLIGFAVKKANEVYCKDMLLALAKKYDLWVMVTSGALALCQLFSIMVASRLACCVSTDDGGHAGQHWRSWEHGNAKTRGGGRNYEMRDRNEGGHQLSYA